MFQFEANETVIVEQQKALEAAISTKPEAQKVLRKIIREHILEARAEVVRSIPFKGGDPRGTARAVRTSVWKKVLGANINIFNSRRSHGSALYEPPRHPSLRGGNRMPRSATTQRMMSYPALDRGFILRFLNSGTQDRYAGHGRNGNTSAARATYLSKTGGRGFRGKIAPGNFFGPLGDRALGRMRDNIATVIEEEMAKIMNNG